MLIILKGKRYKIIKIHEHVMTKIKLIYALLNNIINIIKTQFTYNSLIYVRKIYNAPIT